ncbi:hypothetical protein [Streptomyces sp. NPDC016172]
MVPWPRTTTWQPYWKPWTASSRPCVRGQTGFAAQLAEEAVVEPGTVFL